MRRRDFISGSAAFLATIAQAQQFRRISIEPKNKLIANSGIMTAVTTRGMNNDRNGANLTETVLTQANVGTQGIRQYFNLPMEGDAVGAEAQILIVPSVPCDDGTTRDLAICGSMNNLLYAFDANDSDIVWVKKLAVPVEESLGNIDAYKINDHWGLISTGVVDLQSLYWYGVAWTDPNGMPSTAQYYMHVINLRNGNRVCPPVLVQGTSKGQTFDSMIRKQRSSLCLATINGVKTVFFGCGTMSETSSGSAGWVFAFDVATNTFKSALATTAGDGAGIWMGGGGIACDGTNLYVGTGNGSFDGAQNFGESFLKLSYSSYTLAVVDWWTPWTDSGREGGAVTASKDVRKNSKKLAGISAPSTEENLPVNMAHMNKAPKGMAMKGSVDAGWYDEDLFSSGIMLIEKYHMVIGCGKDGILYAVNSQNMGKTQPADFNNAKANYAKLLIPPQWFTYFPGYQYDPGPQDPTTLDFLPGGKTRHMHSTPIFYSSPTAGDLLFCAGENSPVRVWQIAQNSIKYLAQSNEISSAQVTNSPGGMPGSFMCLSANGSVPGTGLLWVMIPDGDANKTRTTGGLYVYAADVFNNGAMKLLWSSKQFGITISYNKFNPPVVSGGKCFVPTYADQWLVFGLA